MQRVFFSDSHLRGSTTREVQTWTFDAPFDPAEGSTPYPGLATRGYSGAWEVDFVSQNFNRDWPSGGTTTRRANGRVLNTKVTIWAYLNETPPRYAIFVGGINQVPATLTCSGAARCDPTADEFIPEGFPGVRDGLPSGAPNELTGVVDDPNFTRGNAFIGAPLSSDPNVEGTHATLEWEFYFDEPLAPAR